MRFKEMDALVLENPDLSQQFGGTQLHPSVSVPDVSPPSMTPSSMRIQALGLKLPLYFSAQTLQAFWTGHSILTSSGFGVFFFFFFAPMVEF